MTQVDFWKTHPNIDLQMKFREKFSTKFPGSSYEGFGVLAISLLSSDLMQRMMLVWKQVHRNLLCPSNLEYYNLLVVVDIVGFPNRALRRHLMVVSLLLSFHRVQLVLLLVHLLSQRPW